MRKFYLLWLLCLFAAPAIAQTAADTAALRGAVWQKSVPAENVACFRAELTLFGRPQIVSYLVVDTAQYTLHLVNARGKELVSRMAEENDAVAAVNGGFYSVKLIGGGEPINLLKIAGKVVGDRPSGWWIGDGAVATDERGTVAVRRLDPARDTVDDNNPTYVLAAFPMLVENGGIIPQTDLSLHPRTAAGIGPRGIVLAVVDGRQAGSEGMGIGELAWLVRMLGCDQALNLDGGGSSVLWTCTDGVVNSAVGDTRLRALRSEVAGQDMQHKKIQRKARRAERRGQRTAGQRPVGNALIVVRK